jgi:hypothetical protein
MGHPDGAHTHGSGSGGGTIVLVVLATVFAAAVARPVVHAAVMVVHMVLILAVVILGLCFGGLVSLLIWRWRRPDAARVMSPHSILVRAAQLLPPERPAIERPPDIHLHLHGVTAEDIAAIIERQHEQHHG